MADLAAAHIGATFNQYAEGPRAGLLRARLVSYLDSKASAALLLVGEAAGYRGARVSGIPFTSERQLVGSGAAESTATIVHRVLAELDLSERVLLWNVVATHPGTETSNRPPTRSEIGAGMRFVELLAEGRNVVAVGRVAERALGVRSVRHPSHGGAKDFGAGLRELLEQGSLAQMSPDTRQSAAGPDLPTRSARRSLLESAAGGQSVRRFLVR